MTQERAGATINIPGLCQGNIRTSPYFNKSSKLSLNDLHTLGSQKIVTTVLSPRESNVGKLLPDNFECLSPGLQKFYTLKYMPPKSPYSLIQEELHHDPWKMLVATIFLNRTQGCHAIPVLWKFFKQFPDAETTSNADPTEIEDIIQPLGLFRKRAQILIRFSTEYREKMWHYPDELYGIGKYGNDSFRIFCLGEYHDVLPDDHKLNLYHGWLSERDRERMGHVTSTCKYNKALANAQLVLNTNFDLEKKGNPWKELSKIVKFGCEIL